MAALNSIPNHLSVITSLTLRAIVIYFVRWLPLGPRYLPIIYTIATLNFTAFAWQWRSKPRQSSGRPKSSPWRAILFGYFDRQHTLASFVSVCVNLVFLLAALDFVFRSHFLHNATELSFSRVGYVDSNSARIVVRSPLSLVVQIEYRPVQNTNWIPGPILPVITEGHDSVVTFTVSELQDDTAYLYRTNASHLGSFRTTPLNPKRWTIVSTSCLKPFYPYNPFDHSLRIRGLEYLSDYVKSTKADFILFLGDFIYIDLPYRFGWNKDAYYEAYRQVYSSPSWSSELLTLPWLHMYDDHEITNDWSGNETGLFQEALPPYLDYHAQANPPAFRKGATYYTFSHGDVSFFVMDTRRYRSQSDMEDGPNKTMLGDEQRHALEMWLETEKSWKVVVSGVPFTRNWRGPEANDSWAGYLHERQRLLEKMWATTGVIVLSGDRHEHATTLFPSPEGKSNVIEFSTSPLSQFYQPFERQYREIESTDVAIYSHPQGMSKFGSLTFDTSLPGILDLQFTLIVHGKGVWEYNWTLTESK
ncbi:PhoD-like phosphatase-domain-containing protein [Lipomyces kononenkoae]